jgi:serine/threonine protein kinase
LRLSDFTFAASLPEDGSKLTKICGTPPFMSPEMLNKTHGYDSSTDMWSFGVTAYVLMFGHFPYQPRGRSVKALRETISEGNTLPSFLPTRPLSRFLVGNGAKTFVQRLLFREVFGRYTPQKALEDDWLSVAVALGSEGAESLPSMLPTLRLAKRAGLFGVRPARQSEGKSDKVKSNAGPRTRLNKLLVEKQNKHHGAHLKLLTVVFPPSPDACSEDDSRSTTTGHSGSGSTDTFDTDFRSSS